MPQIPLNMYANFTGSNDAAATLDIPDDGVIEGLAMSGSAQLNADNEVATFEVSFIATNQLTSNDSRATLGVMRLRAGLLTSGAVAAHTSLFIPMDIDVSGGERIYIHGVLSGTAAADVNALILLRPARTITRRSRRRR